MIVRLYDAVEAMNIYSQSKTSVIGRLDVNAIGPREEVCFMLRVGEVRPEARLYSIDGEYCSTFGRNGIILLT